MKDAGVSERRACQLVQICRSSYRYQVRGKDDAPIVEALRTISEKHRRYGYRRAHQALVRQTLERINHKRVERLWRENGLTVPRVKRKRRRGKAAPVPLRAERPNHVWTYDFMADSCLSGRKLRFLTVIDEFTRQCLAIEVDYRFPSQKVADCLARLFWKYGTPEYIRSDNGPEFVAKAIRKWLADVEVKTHHIDPGKPWQNAFGESFNGSFRDECLNMEVFHSAREQETGAFKERYKIRSGIEATISEAQRLTGLKRSWTRGHVRVASSVCFKALAINVKRYVQREVEEARKAAERALYLLKTASRRPLRPLPRHPGPLSRQLAPTLPLAA